MHQILKIKSDKPLFLCSRSLEDCSAECTAIINDVLAILKGKNYLLAKEILKVCIEELDYTAFIK